MSVTYIDTLKAGQFVGEVLPQVLRSPGLHALVVDNSDPPAVEFAQAAQLVATKLEGYAKADAGEFLWTQLFVSAEERGALTTVAKSLHRIMPLLGGDLGAELLAPGLREASKFQERMLRFVAYLYANTPGLSSREAFRDHRRHLLRASSVFGVLGNERITQIVYNLRETLNEDVDSLRQDALFLRTMSSIWVMLLGDQLRFQLLTVAWLRVFSMSVQLKERSRAGDVVAPQATREHEIIMDKRFAMEMLLVRRVYLVTPQRLFRLSYEQFTASFNYLSTFAEFDIGGWSPIAARLKRALTTSDARKEIFGIGPTAKGFALAKLLDATERSESFRATIEALRNEHGRPSGARLRVALSHLMLDTSKISAGRQAQELVVVLYRVLERWIGTDETPETQQPFVMQPLATPLDASAYFESSLSEQPTQRAIHETTSEALFLMNDPPTQQENSAVDNMLGPLDPELERSLDFDDIDLSGDPDVQVDLTDFYEQLLAENKPRLARIARDLKQTRARLTTAEQAARFTALTKRFEQLASRTT